MSEEIKNNNEYILLYHRGRGTIKDFMERNFIYGITPEELFDFNKKLIFEQLTELHKEIMKEIYGVWISTEDDLKIDYLLPSPSVLKINPSKITAELAISQTNAQVNTENFYAFAAEKIQEIYQHEGFRKDGTSKQSPDCTVLGWFKSLYYLGVDSKGKPTKLENKENSLEFSDLSRFIISLATNMTSNGGSFVMKLPIIQSNSVGIMSISEVNFNEKGQRQWGDQIGEIGKSKKGNLYDFGSNGEFYSKSSFSAIESNYFNWLISSNDLLFISFEKLAMDMKKDEYTDIEGNKITNFDGDDDSYKISSLLSQGVFDMIGLVDDVKVVTNSQTSESHVEITGRDLMKLLIEDGSFFFNPSTSSDPSGVFANEQSYGKQGDIKEVDIMNNTYNNPINRLRRITGEIDVFANRINMDIGYILKGVISQLANIEVVPGYVFDSWGDERTKFVELKPDDKTE